MGDALGKTPVALGRPYSERARRGRKCRAFADSEGKSSRTQARKSTHRAGRRRGHANDQAASTERQTRAELVTDIASDQLE